MSHWPRRTSPPPGGSRREEETFALHHTCGTGFRHKGLVLRKLQLMSSTQLGVLTNGLLIRSDNHGVCFKGQDVKHELARARGL